MLKEKAKLFHAKIQEKSGGFIQWFHKTFLPEVKKFLHGQNLPERALLLVDNAPCHHKECDLRSNDGEISVMCLSPNFTLMQPMDQNVIRLTKLNYKKRLLSHIVPRGKTIDGSLRNITLKDGICFLANAWNAFNKFPIRSSFQKLFNKSSDWDNEDVIPLSELRLQLADNAFNIQSIATLHQEVEPLQQISHSENEHWIVEPNWALTAQYEEQCTDDDLTEAGTQYEASYFGGDYISVQYLLRMGGAKQCFIRR